MHSEIVRRPGASGWPTERRAARAVAVAAACRSGRRRSCRKVDKLSCVRFGSARYSVPEPADRHHAWPCVVDRRRVLILRAVHRRGRRRAPAGRAGRGHASSTSTTARPRPGSPAARPRPKTVAEKQFCALGAGRGGVPASAPPRRATPGWARELASSLTLHAAHGDAGAASRPWTGRSRSVGGAPTTSARSWPPAPAPRTPARRAGAGHRPAHA